jgi:hypothetical protein
VQQQPSRAAIFGFVAACVSLTAASLISGGVQFADLFSYVSTSIIVGLVINRSGTQNLGWPPIVALFLSRLFACGVALVVAHLQTHGWRIEILMTNVYVPMIITVGWSVGLLIANAIVNDAAYVDKQGRPVIPNAPSDSELCSLTQKVLAEEVFLKAEELANQPGSERITEEHYKRAISLYPYEHRFYLRLAQMYNRLHRYKEAQILFQVTTRVCPQATDAWQSLAALLYNHKQYSRAREACRQALKCATIDGEQLRLVTLCLEDSEKRMLGGKILRFNRA